MKITVETKTGQYVIMADSYGMKAVAGPRLFKASPHPDIKFGVYENINNAESDAQKLRSYLDQLPTKKISKEKLKKHRDQ